MWRALVVGCLFLVACDKGAKDAGSAIKADKADKADKPDKADKATPGAKPAAPPAAKDSVRRVSVETNGDGYTPDRIAGKPGEKLVLVFTRTLKADCISQLKTPAGDMVDLPMGTPVEVAVTVPAHGEIGFACGMDMFHGVVVADPSS